METRLPSAKILVIYNPKAGKGRTRWLSKALSYLECKGASVDVFIPKSSEETVDRSLQAATNNVGTVVAAGGDGTVRDVASGLLRHLGSPPLLGVLPIGTSNVFARELSIPWNAAAAADVLLSGVQQDMYVGDANGRYFVTMVGVGFDAEVVQNLSPTLKKMFGKGAYILNVLRSLVLLRSQYLNVRVDQGPIQKAVSVVVAKSKHYAGSFSCCSKASTSDNLIHVCLFEGAGRVNAIIYVASLVLGRLEKVRGYRTIAAQNVEIVGNAGQFVQADGDIIGTVPIRVKVADRKLQVLRPRI
jgi:diacylglycerol kinase (ATP)